MNIQTAITILFNEGYLITLNPDGDTITISNPNSGTRVPTIQNLLQPYNTNFLTFTQLDDSTQIYFHS